MRGEPGPEVSAKKAFATLIEPPTSRVPTALVGAVQGALFCKQNERSKNMSSILVAL